MAHNPVATQTKLSDNATLHHYVGPAPHTKQGILLYNPKTKLVIIRKSFQPLDRYDLTIPQLPLRVLTTTTQDLSMVSDLLTQSSSTLPTSISTQPSKTTTSTLLPWEEI